jgi:hypothetical protein
MLRDLDELRARVARWMCESDINTVEVVIRADGNPNLPNLTLVKVTLFGSREEASDG